MKNHLALAILLALALSTTTSMAQSPVNLEPNWKLPTDTKAEGGEIVGPRISPADSNWISWEVHDRSQVHLFIYNTAKAERIELVPPKEEGVSDIFGSGIVSCRDLAWCPVPMRGKVWAAFIAENSGRVDLYLYDASSKNYYRMTSLQDSLGSATKRDPAWSPDGKCLAYTTFMSGNADIYLLKPMDDVLKNPADPAMRDMHVPAVTGTGDQFGASWCPVPGSAFFLFNDIGKDRGVCRVRGCDLFLGARIFDIDGTDPEQSYFASSWNPGGTEVAFYAFDGKDAFGSGAKGTIAADKLGLGLAAIKGVGDSLRMTMKRGGRSFTQSIVTDLAPNRDFYTGPQWLPDGKNLLGSIYDEPQKNPAKVIYPSEWEGGSRAKEYLYGEFADGQFSFPLDIWIVGKSVTFSYSQGQQRNLLLGRLSQPGSAAAAAAAGLELTAGRTEYWKGYTTNPSGGFFSNFLRALTSPVGGSDFLINRPILFLPLGGGLVYALTKGGDDEEIVPKASGGHDFRPPLLPTTSTSVGSGIKLSFGF